METPKNYDELDYFTAFACILVILIHVLSLGISNLRPNSWQMILIYFPWRLSSFVVPAFLFCGAVKQALMFYSQKSFCYKAYILRRIVKIYVPYLFANLIYYIAFLSINFVRGDSIKELLKYIILGNITSPFYYIVIIMQFYLLAPFWRFFLKKVPWYIGLMIVLFLTFLFAKISAVFALFGINFQYTDRLFITYLWFWTIGLYTGKYYNYINNSLKKVRLQLCVCIAAICVIFSILSYLQFSLKQYVYDLDALKIFSDSIAIILLFRLCLYLYASNYIRIKRNLKKIHSASYFVYLYHCLFLTLSTNYLQNHGITEMTILLISRAIVSYIVPFSLFSLITRFRQNTLS